MQEIPRKLTITEVISGLTSPVDADFFGSNIYIADQIGKVYSYVSGKLKTALDLTPTINKLRYGLFVRGLMPFYDERGLLGIALHPEFPRVRKIYVYYSAPISLVRILKYNHISRLSEFTFNSLTEIDPKSEKILLEIKQDRMSHNGGCLRFGPDGHLYLSVGDGGRYLHVIGVAHAQDITNLKGSILRMTLKNGKVVAPADNPLSPPGHPLLWVWGLRNPWRFSFDSQGNCFVGDVGESRRESIYLVRGGENCGWPMKEGTLPMEPQFNKHPADPNKKLQKPIFEYSPKLGRSVIGGFVYRGPRPDLKGLYIFADASKEWPHRLGFKPEGRIYALSPYKDTWKRVPLDVKGLPRGELITSLMEDAGGNLWMLGKKEFGPTGKTGALYRLS